MNNHGGEFKPIPPAPEPGPSGPKHTPSWQEARPPESKKPLLTAAAILLSAFTAISAYVSGIVPNRRTGVTFHEPGYNLALVFGAFILPLAVWFVTMLATKPRKNPARFAFCLALLIPLAACALRIYGNWAFKL